jgi:hypothetical protein
MEGDGDRSVDVAPKPYPRSAAEIFPCFSVHWSSISVTCTRQYNTPSILGIQIVSDTNMIFNIQLLIIMFTTGVRNIYKI